MVTVETTAASAENAAGGRSSRTRSPHVALEVLPGLPAASCRQLSGRGERPNNFRRETRFIPQKNRRASFSAKSLIASILLLYSKDGLPLLHPDVHWQGPGHRVASPAAAVARKLEGRLPRRGHHPAIGQKDTFAADRAPRRALAAPGAGGRLLLSWLHLEMILHPLKSSVYWLRSVLARVGYAWTRVFVKRVHRILCT